MKQKKMTLGPQLMISMDVELGKLLLHPDSNPPCHIVVCLMVGQPPLASILLLNQTHQDMNTTASLANIQTTMSSLS